MRIPKSIYRPRQLAFFLPPSVASSMLAFHIIPVIPVVNKHISTDSRAKRKEQETLWTALLEKARKKCTKHEMAQKYVELRRKRQISYLVKREAYLVSKKAEIRGTSHPAAGKSMVLSA
jgi:hypothetical protein